MTKEEALKWSELFKAYAEGKTIQYKGRDNVFRDDIKFSVTCVLETELNRYRIKPEPKYIPYTWEDWKEFMGKEVNMGTFIYNNTIGDFKIAGLSIDSIGFLPAFTKDKMRMFWCSFDEAFKKVTYLDGTPFGKLVEE